jgi:hypothetical protein
MKLPSGLWLLAVAAAVALVIYAWEYRDIRATIDVSELPTVRRPGSSPTTGTGYKIPEDPDGVIAFE